MPAGTRKGVNSIANALFGTTGALAERRGFQSEASGQASIASALFNRSRARTDTSNRNFRNESLTRLRLTNPELFNALAGSTTSNPNQIGQFLKQAQRNKFARGAEEQFRGTPAGPEGQEAVPPNVPLGSQLSSLASGIQTPGQITVSPTAGRVNRFSGKSLDPRLLEASTALQENKALVEDQNLFKKQRETAKINVQIDEIHARTQKITRESANLLFGKGSNAPTGNARLGFVEKMTAAMDTTFKRKRFPQFADPEGDPSGPLGKDLTVEQIKLFSFRWIDELTKASPQEAVQSLQAVPDIDGKDLDEGIRFMDKHQGFFSEFTIRMDKLEAIQNEGQPQPAAVQPESPAQVDTVTGADPGLVDPGNITPGLGESLQDTTRDTLERPGGGFFQRKTTPITTAPVDPQTVPEGLGGALSNILPRAPEGSGPVFEAQGGAPAQTTPFPGIAPTDPIPVEPLTPTAPTAPVAPTQATPQLPSLDPGALSKIQGAPTATLKNIKAEIEQLLKSGSSNITEDHKALLAAINNELKGR